VEELWNSFGVNNLESVYEDLLLIGISVFCADKRTLRAKTEDSWTRHITINIPVLEIDKWLYIKEDMEMMLGFLSGDIWNLEFRKSSTKLRTIPENKRNKTPLSNKYDAVSLFSGGLDSFCGALKLMESGVKTCFVAFREYNLVTDRQKDLFNQIDEYYDSVEKALALFDVTPRPPRDINGESMNVNVESTSRSRSFLFLVGAIAVASMIDKNIPVYIPENGFIGINVPLSDSRNGSCSTRTTHVYFIKSLNKILEKIGITNLVQNFYAFMSKGEIVHEFKDNTIFKNYASDTISCSHPCLSRYTGQRPPQNCGYCYPCIIRKSSLNSIGIDNTLYTPKFGLSLSFIEEYSNLSGKASDLKAVLMSLKKYLINKDDKNYIKHILLKHGELTKEELINYEHVYVQSMEELLKLFMNIDKQNDAKILDYLGYKGE